MSSPAISVAMSVYDGERFLAEAARSVLAQTFRDFELLILDDGSRDSSPEVIRALAASDPRVVPVMRANRGLIASLNELLQRARAPIVARMDADDIAHPDRFARQYDFLTRHPDHGVVGTWCIDIDEHGNRIRQTSQDQPVTWEDFRAGIASGRQLICHPAAMYRRDVVLSVGGYHAAFRHCEDLDLWLRLATVTKLANIPKRLVCYRRSASQVSQRHATEQQLGTAIAHLAYRERLAGRPDPTADLDTLPPIEELDALFGRPGTRREVLERLTGALRYSPQALRSDGFGLILRHVREGGDLAGMWRTVLRLVKLGEPLRALRLAAALARSG